MNKPKVFIHLLLLLAVSAIVFASCKPTVPDEYLQPGELEDVLYDYHIALAMSNSTAVQNASQQTYIAGVLKKHGITQQEFDESMQYYSRHTERLYKIYNSLTERLQDEAESMGASASDLNKYGVLSASGDTANIWTGARSMILLTKAPFNQSGFTIKGDTAFHKGDALMMNFDVDFIYQNGARDGIAVLAMTLSNDSVTSANTRLTSTNHYSVRLNDFGRLGIKDIKGFFLLNKGQSADITTSTLQLMFVSNIQLVRMHESKEEAARRDSLSKVEESRANQPAPASADMRNEGMVRRPASSVGVRPVPQAAEISVPERKPQPDPRRNLVK